MLSRHREFVLLHLRRRPGVSTHRDARDAAGKPAREGRATTGYVLAASASTSRPHAHTPTHLPTKVLEKLQGVLLAHGAKLRMLPADEGLEHER